MGSAERPGANAAPVLPVSLVVSSARLLIERQLGLAWVSGEISNFTRAASGHCYFVLKDANAQARCVLFRSKAQLLELVLRDGLSVEVRATPTIYEARGEFQLNVEFVRAAGLGALYEKLSRLKSRLEAAGWFRQERKRALPRFPRAIGVVTSPHAAALHDVLTTLQRRLPSTPVILYPTAVQGGGAAMDVAGAIVLANVRAEVDVLIVCRGGGSIEDLWAFNEEGVARAVFDSSIPIVSGVGHETDFTICDFVADARAPTPTAAAAMVVPDRLVLLAAIDALMTRWRRASDRSLEIRMQRVDFASRRLVHPAARIRVQAMAVSSFASRMVRAARTAQELRLRETDLLRQGLARLMRTPPRQQSALERARDRWRRAGAGRIDSVAERLAALAQSMRHLNPQGVLDRGYSIVTDRAHNVVQDAAGIDSGDLLAIRFARGQARARVTDADSDA
jgi:exodeoxyribonuclease VII large subunit